MARRHGLWLAYDAAQAFGLTLNGTPIAAYGDATAFSLHATKVLHTGEGGFVVTPDADATARLRRMRNFGLEAGRMTGPGSNGKLSEAQAALGLALHRGAPGASPGLTTYPLRAAPALRARLHRALAEDRVLARDHFALLCGPGTCYPDAPIISAAQQPPVAPRVGPGVLCLPLHGRVTPAEAARIAQTVRRIATEEPTA